MKGKHYIYVRENRKNKLRVFWTELKQGTWSKCLDQNNFLFPQRMSKKDFENFTAIKSQKKVSALKSLIFKYYVIDKEKTVRSRTI